MFIIESHFPYFFFLSNEENKFSRDRIRTLLIVFIYTMLKDAGYFGESENEAFVLRIHHI